MPKNKLVSYNPFKSRFGDRFPFFAQNLLLLIMPQLNLPLQIISEYLGNPAQRRAEDFILSLDNRIRQLELRRDQLLKDPKFITIVITAVQIAIRTHQEEKLEALRTAVINTISNTQEEDVQLIFFRIIDNLTVYDIKVLKKFYTNGFFFEKEISELDLNLVNQSKRILIANGLITEDYPIISTFKPTGAITRSTAPMPVTNSFGREFLSFIGMDISNEATNTISNKLE